MPRRSPVVRRRTTFRESRYCFCRSNFPSWFRIYTNHWGEGGGGAVSAAWTDLQGSDQLWSPPFPSIIAQFDFSIPWDYPLGWYYQFRWPFLKKHTHTNCKLYSQAATTPLQKTANWEGSAYILCSRGKEGNERQRKESARLQHPQHPRPDCHIAAAPLPLLWDLPHIQRLAHSSAEF